MKNYPTKQAKFFCESCGSEVPKNSKICLNCGRFFAAVRCPNCGKTGSNSEFANGCPQCGYAVDGSNGNSKPMSNIKNSEDKYFSQRGKKGFRSRAKTSLYSPESSLPVWIYVLVITVFAVVMICFYKCMI